MVAESPDPARSLPFRRRLGLVAGPVLFLVVLLLPAPAGMMAPAWSTAAVGILMAVWWVTEAIPIAATALLPLVLFPVLGVGGIGDAAAPYANPIIFLFFGGFLIAVAMQRWGLHRRIALHVVGAVGTEPTRLVLGFMLATGFLSMWVSNTATAVMMMPIGLSVIELVVRRKEDGSLPQLNFGTALMLGIAYSASIGGLATLVGTPPNAFMAGFMNEAYGVEIGFAQWMVVGVPLVVVALPATWWLLTHAILPIALREIPGGRAMIRDELSALGAVSPAERRVAAVFTLTALAWMTRPLTDAWVPGLSDAGIAMAAALVLFLLPIGRGEFVLDWDSVERGVPWGVLLLFGGGLSLAGAVSRTGLAEWIGTALSGLSAMPTLLLVAAIVAVVVFLTELTSNIATTAAFLPVLGSLAVGLGENPFLFVIPAALAASCAFMLPVATPPNAIVYGSGYITIPQMSRAGLWLNLVFIAGITALTYTLVFWVFDVRPGVMPPWAR